MQEIRFPGDIKGNFNKIPKVINFSDGTKLGYTTGRVRSNGKVDEHWVHILTPEGYWYAPLDRQYFKTCWELGQKYGVDRVYNDFVKIYDLTTGTVEEPVLDEIRKIAMSYKGSVMLAAKTLVTIYFGMVAEVANYGEKLGKRIKRLGLHQVLNLGVDPVTASNYSKGKYWLTLSEECSAYGF